MVVQVRLGPDLAKAAGVPVAVVDTPVEATAEDVLRQLGETYPALREGLPTALLVAGGRVLSRHEKVPAGVDLVVLQPMAGGAGGAVH